MGFAAAGAADDADGLAALGGEIDVGEAGCACAIVGPFLEMMDILNEQLINEGKEPIVFDHDCREGICGMCSMYINGHPHGQIGRASCRERVCKQV